MLCSSVISYYAATRMEEIATDLWPLWTLAGRISQAQNISKNQCSFSNKSSRLVTEIKITN